MIELSWLSDKKERNIFTHNTHYIVSNFLICIPGIILTIYGNSSRLFKSLSYNFPLWYGVVIRFAGTVLIDKHKFSLRPNESSLISLKCFARSLITATNITNKEKMRNLCI